MDLQLPDRLHATRDLLMRSLALHPLEQAPAIPADLAADLAARFAPRTTAEAKMPPVSWLGKVRSLLATPRFGAIAAALAVIGIAVPMLSGPEAGSPETFRGGNVTSLPAATVRIVFIGDNAGFRAAVENSGDFESSAFTEGGNGPKVIIDFTAGSIRAVDAAGETIHQAVMPVEASDLPAAVAAAISYL